MPAQTLKSEEVTLKSEEVTPKSLPPQAEEVPADKTALKADEKPGEALATPEAEEKPAPVENGNGASRIVRNPTISIKDSLQQEPVPPSSPPTASAEEKGEQKAGQDSQRQAADAAASASDPESILKAWDEYTASIKKSKPRVFSTLKNNRPGINDEGVLELKLNTETQRDNFVKNIRGELSAHIRKATGIQAIDIVAVVVENQRDSKKIYTDQDRLAYLVKKNPDLAELKTRFGLDFDN